MLHGNAVRLAQGLGAFQERYALDLLQIRALGSDAGPPRNSLIRRGGLIPKGRCRYHVLLWIRRLKVRILPPQPFHTAYEPDQNEEPGRAV
jgi:hypothetical protein